eukprot:11023841-Alexandrium_andersonii.AAC.1
MGAPRETQHTRRAAPKARGRRLRPIPSAGQGRFARGPAEAAASSRWSLGPFSSVADGLFRA